MKKTANKTLRENRVWITAIDQIDYGDPRAQENSTTALITILYDNPSGNAPVHLNITAKSFLPPHEDVWFGQNIALVPFGSAVTLSYYADFSILGAETGQDVIESILAMTITDNIQIDSPVPSQDMFYYYTVGNVNFNVGHGIDFSEMPPLPQMNPIQHDWVFAADTTWIYRGCDVPNIDLDESQYPFNFNPETGKPDYHGDLNGCALASWANSISWLENQHEEIETGLDLRGKMELLDEMMPRILGGTVTQNNLITGGLKFIDSLKVPISVKFQVHAVTEPTINSPDSRYDHSATNAGLNLENKGGNVNRVSWDWIVQEMEAGEDVDVTLACSNGEIWTWCHTVVLTGISKDKNNKKLTFKHDKDQQNPGGCEEVQINVNQLADGFLTTNWMSNTELGTCYITDVYSKSYDPTVTFEATESDFPYPDIPTDFKLYQNYPNPFNPITTIQVDIGKRSMVRIQIYEILGKRVETVVDEYRDAGRYWVEWDAALYTSGIYLYRLEAGDYVETRKLVLQK